MNINPYQITPVPDPVQVAFASDFKIEMAFVDPATGETVVDATGENAVLVSELMSSLPAPVLTQMVYELGPRMVAYAKGVG